MSATRTSPVRVIRPQDLHPAHAIACGIETLTGFTVESQTAVANVVIGNAIDGFCDLADTILTAAERTHATYSRIRGTISNAVRVSRLTLASTLRTVAESLAPAPVATVYVEPIPLPTAPVVADAPPAPCVADVVDAVAALSCTTDRVRTAAAHRARMLAESVPSLPFLPEMEPGAVPPPAPSRPEPTMTIRKRVNPPKVANAPTNPEAPPVWQGKGGKWFTKNANGRTVPAKAPPG